MEDEIPDMTKWLFVLIVSLIALLYFYSFVCFL